MNIKQLMEEAKQLRTKADWVLTFCEQESLDDAWRELGVLYTHANLILGDTVTLKKATKKWESIRKHAANVERECDRLAPCVDEQHLAGR